MRSDALKFNHRLIRGGLLVVLLLFTLAGCAGGYDGPPETQFSPEHSHGHP